MPIPVKKQANYSAATPKLNNEKTISIGRFGTTEGQIVIATTSWRRFNRAQYCDAYTYGICTELESNNYDNELEEIGLSFYLSAGIRQTTARNQNPIFSKLLKKRKKDNTQISTTLIYGFRFTAYESY